MEHVGALALVGSGEYLPVMQDLEGALLRKGIERGKKNRYVQLPLAAGRESETRLEYWRTLGKEQTDRIGAEQIFLPVFSREDAMKKEFAEMVEDAGLIYLSGGDPHYLAASLINTPVWEAMERNWRSGTSLAGCSAGAMAMAGDIPNFRKMKEEGSPGLNILPRVRTIPHYNKFFGWIPDAAASVMLRAPGGVWVIGVDEGTAAVSGLDPETSYVDSTFAVHGIAGVHVLKGGPTHKYVQGETLTLK